MADDLTVLDRYYLEAKYPMDPAVDYSKAEADAAVKMATKIFEFIEDSLKKEEN